MKKLILLFACVALSTTIWAQNDVPTAMLQHDDQVTVFTGMNALVLASNAAADGDVITLSAGNFRPATITKAVSIYGAGFENYEPNGTDTTMIKGALVLDVAANVLIEGLNVDGNIECSKGIDNLTIRRCWITGIFRPQAITNSHIYQCWIRGIETSNTPLATDFYISNCRMGWLFGFDISSTVHIDHCLITGGFKEASSAYFNCQTYTNCIFTYSTQSQYLYTGKGSQMVNCIYVSPEKLNSQATVTNCYQVELADIFADGEDVTYSAERTFELKHPELWASTDGTQIGVAGGLGWNKTPTTPVLKDVQVNVEGKKLNVTFDAIAR
ncbi:MAG: hypothetical protein IK092_04365 [Muribaculaceae bacterium]|nr:hypothetical protein [Muribaculaceae bacterium]